jgi:glycosyltransferase involved in cell wall biosynthesis
VIHNGIPIPSSPKATAGSTRRIGFLGRLEPQKDPLLFLDVVEQLPGIEATMVGGGSLEVRVRREIDLRKLTSVRTLGALAHDAALETLSGFTVLVFTSRWEGFPLSALEGMALGVPVVATNVGGLSEVIKDGESGILVDSRSPEVIASAVRKVLEDKPLRERIIAEGRRRVQEHFSEDRMLSEIRRVYSSLLPDRAS